MGDTKKIDVIALASKCRSWLPVFKAAEHLCNIGIVGALDSDNYVSFAEIQEAANLASGYTISGTHRIVSLSARAGLVEKNPNGGRGPLYRATPLMKKVLDANTPADVLYILATHGEILNALGEGDKNQSTLCEYTGTQQTTMSLQMKRLVTAGWVDRRQDGKEVWYSLSDHAKRVMPIIAAELQLLK